MLDNRLAFHIFGHPIYWYGVFFSIGVLAAISTMQWRAKRDDIPPDRVNDLCFAAVLGGLIGARLFYVAINWKGEFSQRPLIDIIRINEGGLVFYGGFFGATIAVLWMIRHRQLHLWRIADLFAIGVPLGQVFGRIGCFFNGCCHGRPTDAWFGVTYPHYYRTGTEMMPSSPGWIQQVQGLITPDQPCLAVIPTQLFQSLTNLGIVIVLLAVSRRALNTGQLFALFLILYSVGRFMNEFNRGDYTSHYLPPLNLTIAQLICPGLLIVGAFIYRQRRRARLNHDQPNIN